MFPFPEQETKRPLLLARRNAHGRDILRTIRRFSGIELDCEEVDNDLCGIILKNGWTFQSNGNVTVVYDDMDREMILSFEATPDRGPYSVIVNHES